MFEVRNLAFSYRGHSVLRDVSFVVSPGEVVSVVGGNGAGKTTMLRILSTLLRPDAGQVLSEGLDAFARPLRYRRQLGYLPENPALYEDMTVKEYLGYRTVLKGEPVKRIRRRVNEAVEMCRIGEFLKSSIGGLSNGVKRRVALADAIILRPRVLLLDDFLAGFDTSLRDLAGTILSEAAAFSSVIVTGHEISDFVKWTTRFLVLRGGVISSIVPSAGANPVELEMRVRAALNGEAV